jgi:nickel-dependent lactate racemase
MKQSIPYKQDSIEVEIDQDRIAAVLEPKEVPVEDDPHKTVRDALEHQAGEDLDAFISTPGPLLVIVNDGTRPTPTRVVLEVLADALEREDARFVIATGAHRGATEEELTYIFGSTLERFRDRIKSHDAKNDPLYRLGRTSRGTEVRLNTLVRDSERILIIGSVEPHFFAGYTGGRKGFLPGVAAYDTIESNHKMALSPEAKTLALKGNPIHEDMMEACAMIDKKVFTIMTVLDRHQNIYAVTAGGLGEAFDAAVLKAREVFVVPFREAADLVIACARYPMDIDLYQSQKAIENGRLALKPGGILLLVSACRHGIGGETFYKLLSSCDTPTGVLEQIEREYRLGYHKAAKIAELCQESGIAAYTELAADVLGPIFIEPVPDLQEFLDAYLSGTDKKVILMPDATVTIPSPET